MSKLTMKINGKMVAFFSATLTFSIEQLAHTFDVTIAPASIKAPLQVAFYLDEEAVFVGQIDGTEEQVSGNQDVLRIFGRSKSANMIDSRIKMDAVYVQRLDSLLKLIAGQFELSVKNHFQGSLPEIFEFQINAESPLANLSQVAKQQRLTLIEQLGTVVIESPGQFAVQNMRLEEGVNLSSFSIKRNWSHQYHHYEVQGAWAGEEAIVTYLPANQARKLIVIADKLQDAASCKSRAEYERDLAIAKSLTVSATVPGLHKELTGASINKIVQVVSKRRNFRESLLIKSVSMSVTDKEQNTQIELFRPFDEAVE